MRGLGLALGMLACAPGAWAQSFPAPAALDALFSEVGASDATGCAVGLYGPNGQSVFQNYGLAEIDGRRPIGADTPFNIGSDAKQFTAFAILVLVDQGRLRLDDDARRLVPQLAALPKPVTVEQLLLHTSGLPDYYDLWNIVGVPDVMTPEAAVDIVARSGHLNFDPGSDYAYSNANYQILAVVASRVAGMPFAQVMDETIFKPLGMTHTRVAETLADVPSDRAVTYRRQGETLTPQRLRDFVTGATGVYSTTADMERWTRSLIRRDLAPSGVYRALETPGRLADGTPLVFSPGLEIRKADGVTVLTHGGESLGYISHTFVAPDRAFGGTILCNTGRIQPGLKAEALIRGWLPGYSEAELASDAPPVSLEDKAGLYLFPDGSTSRFSPIEGGLALEGIPRFTLTPMGGSKFRLGQIPVYMAFGDGGGRDTVERTMFGLGPALGERVENWTPSVEEQAEIAGVYENAALGQTLTFRVEQGVLAGEAGDGSAFTVEPTARDVMRLRNVGGFLAFRRDARGRITGVDYTSDSLRLRRLAFVRK